MKVIISQIKQNDYKEVLRWVNYFDFSLDTPAKIITVKSMINHYKLKISPEQAISILRSANTNRIMHKISWINDKNLPSYEKNITKMVSSYDNGNSIVCLTHKYGLPPLTILKEILLFKETTKFKETKETNNDKIDNLRRLFSGKSHNNPLSGRDLHEYFLAEQNDATSPFNQRINSEKSKRNEDIFVSYFANIKHKTEDDLRKEYLERESGEKLLTPDILFLEDVFINDVKIHWIDYKDYAGTPLSPMWSSCREQAKKYAEKWGKGAICYRFSYVEGMELDPALIEHAVLLDVRGFPNMHEFESIY